MVKFKIVLSVLFLLICVNGFGADPVPSCEDDGDDSDCNCCQAAIDQGVILPGQGLVICCGVNDGPYACYNPLPTGPGSDPENEMENECTNAHEQWHKDNDQPSCVGGNEGTPMGASSTGDLTYAERECLASKAEIQCMKNYYDDCSSDACRWDMEFLINAKMGSKNMLFDCDFDLCDDFGISCPTPTPTPIPTATPIPDPKDEPK
jgi:hypothetical protein